MTYKDLTDEYDPKKLQNTLLEQAHKVVNAAREPDSGAAYGYTAPPAYNSPYQGRIETLTDQLSRQKSFSYDPARDPLYEQYRKAYTREGARAMQDTVGQVSARTGGLASSYAATAGAQAYNTYLAKLGDKIPELQQLAYEMYAGERKAKRDDIDLLLALERGEADRYQTLMSQYNRNRDFDYKAWLDGRK